MSDDLAGPSTAVASPSPTANTLPTVLVLASGRGERFAASGGTTHKLQALLGGTTVLERTLAAVRASGLPWHLEQQGLAGMGDSIAAAVAATADAAGWLILPADLPLIQSRTLRAVGDSLADGLQPAGVVVPVFEGRRGHPVGFGPSFRNALLALAGSQGAARLIPEQGTVELPVDDAGIQFDIDTVDDLQRAQAWLDSRSLGRVKSA